MGNKQEITPAIRLLEGRLRRLLLRKVCSTCSLSVFTSQPVARTLDDEIVYNTHLFVLPLFDSELNCNSFKQMLENALKYA